MSMAQVVQITGSTLEIAFIVSAPILAAAIVVSELISVGQVLTSMQDATLSTVPRIAAVGAFAFWLTPWMMRRLVLFTVELFGNFRHLVQ
ncbi:MAG TPA: flagellar biosynthetic protein FliQ [Candidatus Dormibacteraeota bacterium]|nr:flagellar biosynthetic protein FliQ [Candidatus Dormibacteraeota bacterium]